LKFYKNTFLLLIAVLCFCNVHAQNKDSNIIGQIKSAQNEALKDVAVYLLRSGDSSLVKFTAPDKNGYFEFTALQPGCYLVKITGEGYKKPLTKVCIPKAGADIAIGTIQLYKNVINLNKVEIEDTRPFIDVRPGKTVLNINNSIISTGKTALEILKSAPSVKVDNDNNIFLNNKNNVLVLIDNKPTYLPPSALIDILQSTQSNMIDQIELISNPGAAYDAAGTGGIINIRLKRDKNYGTNGSVLANAGVNQLGDSYGSKFRGGVGISFNTRTKDLDVFGSYSYTYLPINRILLTDRFVDFNNQITEINTNYFSDQSRKSNTYRFGADYNISQKHIIGFLINGYTSSFILNKTTNTDISNNGLSDSTILTNSKLNSQASRVAFDLNYKGSFNKAGELSVDLDYSTYSRNPLELINSDYYSTNINNVKLKNLKQYRTLDIQNTYPSHIKIYAFNIDYSLNLSSSSTLRTIIKSSYVKANNNLNFGEIINGIYHPDPTFTNQFDYTENINAAAVIYNKTISKQISLEAGLRAEQTISDGESVTLNSSVKNNYVDLFPDFHLTDAINANNQLQLSYSKRISRPEYTDLNPFVAYQDEYNYYVGNPYLKPFYINSIELQHIYKSKFSTTLRFGVTNNFVQSILIQNDTTKIVVTKKVNLGNRYVYGIQLGDQAEFTNWWKASFNLDASYQRFTGVSLNSGSQDIDLKIQQSFTLIKSLKAELNAEYETPTTYGIFQYKSLYTFDAGLSQNINKQAVVTLNVNDIFNTNRNRFSSTYQNLDITANDKTTFRVIQLSFSYKFGSKTVKSERVRKTGSESEEGRLGNGL